MDAPPELGLASVKRITLDGQIIPTIRRVPNAMRAFWQALGCERYPLRAPWLDEPNLTSVVTSTRWRAQEAGASPKLAAQDAFFVHVSACRRRCLENPR